MDGLRYDFYYVLVCTFGLSAGIQLGDGSFLYCIGQDARIYCVDNTYQLSIVSASYGRDPPRCGASGGSTCEEPSTTATLGDICNGNNTCSFNITDEIFGSSCGPSNKRLHFWASCYLITTTTNTITSQSTAVQTTVGSTSPQTGVSTTDQPSSTTSVGFSTAATSTGTSTTAGSNMCLCSCHSENNSTLENRIQEIKDILTIDKNTLSSKIRAKTSAADARETSAYMGYTAIIFISLILGLLILVDVLNIFSSFN